MSVRITLHCEQTSRYGTCPNQLITDALTIEEARAAGDHEGWRTSSTSGDICPGCSGHRRHQPGTNVVLLHSRHDDASPVRS